MSDSMIERVARAILRYELSELSSADHFDREWALEPVRAAYLGRARAAIEAMPYRPYMPTIAMLGAGHAARAVEDNTCLHIWWAMYNAAVKEGA